MRLRTTTQGTLELTNYDSWIQLRLLSGDERDPINRSDLLAELRLMLSISALAITLGVLHVRVHSACYTPSAWSMYF